MTNPITPFEAAKNKLSSIPDEVIESFNELIWRNYANIHSIFWTKESNRTNYTKNWMSTKSYLRKWMVKHWGYLS